MAIDLRSPYSSQVSIRLEIGDTVLRLAEVLRGRGTLFESADIPAQTVAELIITIDGSESRRRVFLPEGISKDSFRVNMSEFSDRPDSELEE